MSIPHKFVLLFLMAFAAMAMAASSASAQEVSVINEETGAACNPCTIHIEGEHHLTAVAQGVKVSKCHDELRLRIYGSGSGEIEWTGTQHVIPDPGCNVVNCTGVSPSVERHWPWVGLIETGGGTEQPGVRFCFRTTGDLHCDAPVAVRDISTHLYELSVTALCANGARRLEGMWSTEHLTGDDQEMEIIHHS